MRANEKRMREIKRLEEERYERLRREEQKVKMVHVVHIPKKEKKVPAPLLYQPRKPEEKSESFKRRKQYDELTRLMTYLRFRKKKIFTLSISFPLSKSLVFISYISFFKFRRYHADNKTVYTTLHEDTKPQGILKSSTKKVTTIVHEPKPPPSPKTSTTGTVKYTRKLKPRKNEPCPFQGQNDTEEVIVERKYDNDSLRESSLRPSYLTRLKQKLDHYENDDSSKDNDVKIYENERKTVKISDIDKELLEADEKSKKLQESGNGKRGSENPGRANLLDSEPRQGSTDLEDDIGSEASGVRNPRDDSSSSGESTEPIDRSKVETGSIIERRERYNHSTWPSYR